MDKDFLKRFNRLINILEHGKGETLYDIIDIDMSYSQMWCLNQATFFNFLS